MMNVNVSKAKTLADGTIERTLSILDGIESKTVDKDEEYDQQSMPFNE